MLKVRHLTVHFPHPQGDRVPLLDWNLDLAPGEILGLVGRSGCGKTVFCSTLMGILEPPGYVAGGDIGFCTPETGTIHVLTLTERQWQRIRGRRISMIFQNPLASLSPTHKVGSHFHGLWKAHAPRMGRKARIEQAEALLAQMLFPDPRRIMESYAHELSGGMGQRVAIALALAHRPELLIADEPTTALDVISESQIIRLFARIRKELGTAILFVSHDEPMLRGITDRLVRMPYA
ncbi:MAG: ABC transporter ATP-binding protein [Treponema sp.]|nr:ABC transporter ATP-binding protein [Treponema sp.]